MTARPYTLTLDPAAVAPDRTPLELNSGEIAIGGSSSGTGIDWGQAAITEYLAQQGAYGSTVTDFAIPNRTITIPFMLGASGAGQAAFDLARQQLRQKVALLQREGGQLGRFGPGLPNMYADIVDAALTLPDAWGETGGIEPNGVLTLACLPDFYGDEITLDTITATGCAHAVLTASSEQAIVQGDYPGRARIAVTDTSGNDQLGLLWAFRSRHYDAASTAALFYEAEALTPLSGASASALAGASGGSVVELPGFLAGVWIPMLATDLVAGALALTHTGTYRVWVRVPNLGGYASVDAPQLRLSWGVGSLAVPEVNDPVSIPLSPAGFFLLDLGTVRLDAPPVGPMQWTGVIEAMVGSAAPVAIDCVCLQPLDEAAGRLTYVSVPPAGLLSASRVPSAGTNDATGGTIAWSNPGNIATGGFAYANFSGGSATTNYLDAEAFGFTIPSGATIDGIAAEIQRTGTTLVADAHVQLIKASAIQATDRASAALWAAGSFASYGGSSDMWGGAWTPADINNAGFGLAIAAHNTGAGQARVYVVKLTVYFSLPGGFGASTDAVMYASRTVQVGYDGMFRTDPAGTVYGPASSVRGDLARIPPSGMEDRAVELFVKPSEGDLDTLPDAGLDSFTAQVVYRPCWLHRP